MKGPALFLIFLIFINPCYALINEIMYNPAENEYDFEYIEIYGENLNISGWYFEGIDFIFPENTHINGYLAIANSISGFSNRYGTNISFEYTGTLLNSGETIILRDSSGKIIDTVTYYDWADENHSLERIDLDGYSSDPDNWKQSVNGGTPGKENGVSQSGCDWTVLVLTDGTVFEDPKFRIKSVKLKGTEKANLTIQKWIEDSAGNIVKTYSDWNLQNVLNYATSSEYSPSLTKGNAYFIKADIVDVNCEDINSSNNFVSEMIYIVDEEKNTNPNSSIIILSAPNSEEFGEIINVKINVYKGDTAKYAVYAYVEDEDENKVSEKSTLHFKNTFTNYSLTVPIQLDLNCDEDHNDDDYVIVIEGLDIQAEQKIELQGKSDECPESMVTQNSEKMIKSTVSNEQPEEKIIEIKEIVEKEIIKYKIPEITGIPVLVYESAQAKAEKIVVYFMIGLLALTTLFLVFKKY